MTGGRRIVLPNFLIVGAAKSGTTSLYYYIKQHPEVFMSQLKEPHFFLAQFVQLPLKGVGDNRKKLVNSYQDYCKLFEHAFEEKAIGEASGSNLYYYGNTIPYIKQYLDDPKIIIILRNPVERAFSAYISLVLQGREWLSFEEALGQESHRISAGWRHSWFYTDLGFYYNQVRAYMENFSEVKVCFFEDLLKNPGCLVQVIYSFLDVDPSFLPDTSRRFSVSGLPRSKVATLLMRPTGLQSTITTLAKSILTERIWMKLRDAVRDRLLMKSQMKLETRRYLCDLFHEDILKLQGLLRKDLTPWLDGCASTSFVELPAVCGNRSHEERPEV